MSDPENSTEFYGTHSLFPVLLFANKYSNDGSTLEQDTIVAPEPSSSFLLLSRMESKQGTSTLVKNETLDDAEENPNDSTIGGKRISQERCLTRHKPIYIREGQYTCLIHANKFFTNSNIPKQKLIHNREKPYECSKCGKKLVKNSTLTQHKLIHAEEKPYECYECGKMSCEKLSISAQTYSHWRKATSMFRLWEEVYSKESSYYTHAHSHGRKAI